uniref:F-box domain-containing protein n=1 Tax=viral metagenome TaxID=1070528 RepID=A0A6C0C7U3_9ZZZZ
MNDLLLCICDHLFDKDKLLLLSVTKSANELKRYVFFRRKVYVNKIQSLFYFDSFLNVISNGENIMPRCVKSVHVISNQMLHIPDTVIKIHIGAHYGLGNISALPPSIQHLSVYERKDLQNVYIMCPNIYHLTFYMYAFLYLETLDIPAHITSLKLYHTLSKSYKKIIPATVTHLSLENGDSFNVFDYVPKTITHLKVYQSHLDLEPNTISDHIVRLVIVDDYNEMDEILNHQYDNIPDSLQEFIIFDKHRYKKLIKYIPERLF